MQVIELINKGSKHLKNEKIMSHRLDSEVLLSKVLKKTREEMLINLNENLSIKIENQFYKLLKRRKTKEPIAYIFNEKEFWNHSFFVNKNTLIPRPETELLVEEIVKIYKSKAIKILDIGTGSGCILLSILTEIKRAKGIGVDISQKAIKLAKKNAKKLKLTNRAKFLNNSISQLNHRLYDLIVSNPPYIMRKDLKNLDEGIRKFEPKIALDGGNDGLDVIKKIIYKAKSILKFKGMLALEIGNGQHKKVSKILKKYKFKTKLLVRDYRENVRCIISILES
tara:strand:- start:49 stop:891 length:843 start_codon:yes stop_codon:yes gene_type:complete